MGAYQMVGDRLLFRRGVFWGISNELKSKNPRILDVFSLIAVPS